MNVDQHGQRHRGRMSRLYSTTRGIQGKVTDQNRKGGTTKNIGTSTKLKKA